MSDSFYNSRSFILRHLTGFYRILTVEDERFSINNDIQYVLVHLTLPTWPKFLIMPLGIEKGELFIPHELQWRIVHFYFSSIFKLKNLTLGSQNRPFILSLLNGPFRHRYAYPVVTGRPTRYRYPQSIQVPLYRFDLMGFYETKIFWL